MAGTKGGRVDRAGLVLDQRIFSTTASGYILLAITHRVRLQCRKTIGMNGKRTGVPKLLTATII